MAVGGDVIESNTQPWCRRMQMRAGFGQVTPQSQSSAREWRTAGDFPAGQI